MLVKNLTNRSFTLPTGHVLAPGKNQLPKTTLMHPDNGNYIAGLELSGRIQTEVPTAIKQKRAEERQIARHIKPYTRSWVASIGRGELSELAEMHGIKPEKSMTDDQLRSLVSEAMFVDL